MHTLEVSNASNSHVEFHIPDDDFILKYSDLKFLENSKHNNTIDITELTIYKRYPSSEFKYLEKIFYEKIMIIQKICTSESLSLQRNITPKTIKMINYCTACEVEIGNYHKHIGTTDNEILTKHYYLFIEYLELQGADELRSKCINHIRYSLVKEGFTFTCSTYCNILFISLNKTKSIFVVILITIIIIIICKI
jgi:hypothetical protein